MITALEMVRDKRRREPYPWQERRGLAVYRHALSRGVLLKIERPLVLELCARFPAFRERLHREMLRTRRRDLARQTGQRLPPQEPPLEIATRLQVTPGPLAA